MPAGKTTGRVSVLDLPRKNRGTLYFQVMGRLIAGNSTKALGADLRPRMNDVPDFKASQAFAREGPDPNSA